MVENLSTCVYVQIVNASKLGYEVEGRKIDLTDAFSLTL